MKIPVNKPVQTDSRGFIQNLLFHPVQSIALIRSRKGTVRSNHYHKKNGHFLYVIRGEMKYYERDLNDETGAKSTIITVKKGEMIWTAPNKVHKTVFTKNTLLLSLTLNTSQADQEMDTIREEF